LINAKIARTSATNTSNPKSMQPAIIQPSIIPDIPEPDMLSLSGAEASSATSKGFMRLLLWIDGGMGAACDLSGQPTSIRAVWRFACSAHVNVGRFRGYTTAGRKLEPGPHLPLTEHFMGALRLPIKVRAMSVPGFSSRLLLIAVLVIDGIATARASVHMSHPGGPQ